MKYRELYENKGYTLKELESLIDTIPYALWIMDSHGTFKYANKVFLDMIKLSKEDIIGEVFTNIKKNEFNCKFKDLYDQLVNSEYNTLKKYIICIDSEEYIFEIYKGDFNKKNTKFDGQLFILRNLSIENILEEIKVNVLCHMENEKQQELFLGTVNNLFATASVSGYKRRAITNWTKILGWTKKELDNFDSLDLIHPDDLKYVYDLIKDILEGKEVKSITARFRCKNKDCRLIEWRWRCVKDDNFLILSGEDITEKNKLEKNNEILENMFDLEVIKSEFFSNVSHKFKIPLNIILSILQSMSKKNSTINTFLKNNKINGYINGIRENSYRLLRLVNNLIDISEIDLGKYTLNKKNYNIITIIEDIVLAVEVYLADKSRNIKFYTKEKEVIVACDLDNIERIILNLISNGIKYTNSDENITITLEVDKTRDKAIICVKNDGYSISEEYIDRIFDRFTKEEPILSRRCEGSGLGLALSKSLVELHGGKIWANPKVEKGVEIYFTLPIKKANSKCDLSEVEGKSKIEKCRIEFSDIYSF